MIFLGIDNSLSGALAAINHKGEYIDACTMPITHDSSGLEVVDLEQIEEYIIMCAGIEGQDYMDTVICLERPCFFTKGKNAMRVMWHCFGRIEGKYENGQYPFYTVTAQMWQNKLFSSKAPAKESKILAEKKVIEMYGRKFGMNKKEQGAKHDALLIANYIRLEFEKAK